MTQNANERFMIEPKFHHKTGSANERSPNRPVKFRSSGKEHIARRCPLKRRSRSRTQNEAGRSLAAFDRRPRDTIGFGVEGGSYDKGKNRQQRDRGIFGIAGRREAAEDVAETSLEFASIDK